MMLAPIAIAIAVAAGLTADDPYLTVKNIDSNGKETSETNGKPLSNGFDQNGNPTPGDNDQKAVDSAIGLLGDLAAAGCIPSGDPSAMPPIPPLGGAPGDTPQQGILSLGWLNANNRIGKDTTLGRGPGSDSGTTAATYPGDEGTFPGPGGSTIDARNTGGMNVGEIPFFGTPSDLPGIENLDAYAAYPPGSDCYWPSNDLLDLMLDLGHENTPLEDPRDDLRDLPEEEVEGPALQAEIEFLCELNECLANGSAGPEATAFFDPPSKAMKKACENIKKANTRRAEMGLAQISCSSCPNNGICPNNDLVGDPTADGHPSNTGQSVPTLDPTGICGSMMSPRLGYFHLSTKARSGISNLTAELSQATNTIEVALTGIYPPTGEVEHTIDCSTISPPGDHGAFKALSVAATSANSLLIGGYFAGDGNGAFISYLFRPNSATSTSGTTTTQLAVSKTVLYLGCAFPYPVALGHWTGDSIAYFFDRDRQAVGGIDLNSGAVFELASSSDHSEIGGSLYMRIGRYSNEDGDGQGIRLSLSPLPTTRVVMRSQPGNPVFNLADTDGDLRLDYFWAQH